MDTPPPPPRRPAVVEGLPLVPTLRVVAASCLDIRSPIGVLLCRAIARLADDADRVDAQCPEDVLPHKDALDDLKLRQALALAYAAGRWDEALRP